jgi:hypothetical protein
LSQKHNRWKAKWADKRQADWQEPGTQEAGMQELKNAGSREDPEEWQRDKILS